MGKCAHCIFHKFVKYNQNRSSRLFVMFGVYTPTTNLIFEIQGQFFKVKLSLSLCVIKHLNVRMCEGIDAELPTFLASALY